MRQSFVTVAFMYVLWLLAGCADDKVQMRQQLEMLEQQNRSGESMLNDSLAELLVTYFDRHGDANEQMRSHYILGRTYYCLGELPRALETYNKAIDCADTTDADCNYKVLSRIHAQSAVIYDSQVLPNNRLKELRLAEYYARKGKDTLQAIECYSQQAGAYAMLHKPDSLILIREKASAMYSEFGRPDRSAIALIPTIHPLLIKHEYDKARYYLNLYETNSQVFDKDGNIEAGREIYYYIKGEYYLSINQLDSAEHMFRTELLKGKDLNNQIAGCKGLQEIYEKRGISDSIAKYATLSYELNDSAYSLAEMQNIQKFQSSYNYNHHKQLAEEKTREARNAYIAVGAISCFVVLVGIIIYLLFRDIKKEKEQQLMLYRKTQDCLEKAQTELLELRESNINAKSLINRKCDEIEDMQAQLAELRKNTISMGHANMEDQLDNSDIVKELKLLLKANPVQPATQFQMKEVKKLINEHIPTFYDTLNSTSTLRLIEYEVCLLVRCHFKPAEICKLMDRDDGYISNLRKGILLKVYGIKGIPNDLDRRILQIM
jgi:hypothetical protein